MSHGTPPSLHCGRQSAISRGRCDADSSGSTEVKRAGTDHGHEDRDRGRKTKSWIHGCQPRSETGEARLRSTVDAIERVLEEAAGHLGGALGQPMGHDALDVLVWRHAGRPPKAITRVSASSAARIARWAWWRRERTVPRGMPRISAISTWSRPSKWW